ncbi:polysaccharide deacetylase family protein [Paenibacillus sp. GCM10027627]|uniref:polysaccharide deacetylase family protein n=1 Tax=unclassified Paenibacillus TaxID=185978 RepID=UPI00364173B9
MNKKWYAAFFALALVLQLSGCGNAAVEQAAAPAAVVPAQTETAPVSIPSNTPSSAKSSPPPTAETEKAAEPLYEMNKAFRFVPLNERVPEKAVLLTFDDGPKDEKTIRSLLDTLDKHKAKAIFFVNGYRVEQNPELLKLIHERGQMIGNHSFDHINLKKEDEATVESQIGKVQQSVKSLIGSEPVFFRPPYGEGNDTVKAAAKNHGMLYMTWSNGSLDWDASAKNKPEVVIQNVMDQLHPGANILMHELQWTADALDTLMDNIETEGYTFIDPGTIRLMN